MAEKILIVDDDANVRFVLHEAFAAEYIVFTAADGMCAMEIINKENPALILLDINMPQPDGVAVLKLIKEAGRNPIVWMLTGIEDLDMVLKTLKMGASGYITKPFDVAKIREIVANAIQASSGKEGDRPNDKPWRVKKPQKKNSSEGK